MIDEVTGLETNNVHTPLYLIVSLAEKVVYACSLTETGAKKKQLKLGLRATTKIILT